MEVLHDRGPTVFIITLVLIILTTVFSVLRVISKWGITRKTTPDDFFAIIAWVLDVALSVSIMIGTQVGLGAPDSEILPQWENPLERCIYAFTVLYNPAIMTTKTAILILYYRMATAHAFLRHASIFLIAVVNIAGIVLTFLNIFRCRPVYAAFTDVDGTCIDIISLYLSSAPINVVTDLAILLLPLPLLTALRLEFRQKVILVATFILGGFAAVVDVVRIAYLQTALKEERAINRSAVITATTRTPNFTYNVSFSLMWSAVDVSVGIICCCILVLKPLVMRIMPRLLHKGHRHSTTGEGLLTSGFSKGRRSFDVGAMDPGSPFTSPLPNLGDPQSPTSALFSIPEQNSDDGETLDFFEMLASETADTSVSVSPLDGLRSRQTSVAVPHSRRDTVQTDASQAPTQNFFDFVNMKGKTPLTQLSRKEAWWPVLFVSILFFLWGFAQGLINTLNGEIQTLLGYSSSQIIALHNAYSVAYFFGPALVGYWVLKRKGFKATFIAGLAIYAVGAMSFWPSSVLRSYPGLFISNFIMPIGLSCLEIAANPFIALAGPGELSEARLNFAQGIQQIGLTISPIVTNQALFPGINEEDLFKVQWCYLAVAFFVTLLSLVFYYVPLSEASDDDLASMALQRLRNANLAPGVQSLGLDARKLLLWTGVFSMFTYLGAQEVIRYYFADLVEDVKPGADQFWNSIISHGVDSFGRFLGAGLAYFGVPPRIFLGVYIFGAFLSSLLAIVLPQGSAALSLLILTNFFESTIFPTLFAMTLRGQGKHTKFAAAAVIMAESGGAVWPGIVYAIGRYHPGISRYPLLVAIPLYAVLIFWPAMLSSTRVLRKFVDPVWSKRVSVGRGRTSWSSTVLGHDKAFGSHLEDGPQGGAGAARNGEGLA